MNIPLAAAALICAIAGAISLMVAKRTGEVHANWFHDRPELVPIFERVYRWLGYAGLALALLLAVFAFASGTLSTFSG